MKILAGYQLKMRNPAQVPALIHPIASGQADYVKGDRFFFFTNAASMPPVRRFGNLALSFLAKLSSGYWTIMDPTNGFFAIHARVADLLAEQDVAKRFFFEVIERRGYRAYGAANATIRLAAQSRYRDDLDR